MAERAGLAPPALSRTETTGLVAALVVAAFFLAFGGLHYGFFTRNLLLDTPIYEHYGDSIVHDGKLPYRDFAVEYPPGALPVFAAPSLAADAGDFTRYARLFEALMLLCGAAASAVVGFVLVRRRAGAATLIAGILLAGLAPLALGPVVLSRFDLWPAALTIGALGALLADRRLLGFGLLGGAIAAKIYPAVLLPLAIAYVWRRRGARDAAVCTGVLAAVVAACVVPFLALAPSGVWESLTGQASRPLQIESLGASFLLAGHHLWGLSLTEVSSHGSDNLVGRLPHALAVAQSLLVAAALVGIWVAFARGRAAPDRLLRYSAAAVCAFIVLNKVLSPQYLVWLIALIPLVRGRRLVPAAALFVVCLVLTQMWFPQRYIGLVYGLEARASWLVLARDLALGALLVTLVWPGRRALRLGASIVAVLTLGTAAAFGAALASPTGSKGPTHSGLLDETGVTSSCASPKPVPATSGGVVSYDVAAFGNPGRRRCVSVTLTTDRRVQVFSAAYLGLFDPANARAHYLGDAGACTNLAGATGRVLTYSFAVPRNKRFVVEVEECGSAQGLARYTLDVRAGRPVVTYVFAKAGKSGDDTVIRWRTRRRAPDLSFAVFREQDGVRVRLNTRPIRGNSFIDRRPPLGRSVRYWLRAVAPGGWSWRGPLYRP